MSGGFVFTPTTTIGGVTNNCNSEEQL